METEQAGFRAGQSTIDHVFCLKQLTEKMMSVDQPLHLLFVDLEKTYDGVPLKNLWRALEHCNISNSTIRAINRIHEKLHIYHYTCSSSYRAFIVRK
jgi:hypothetical protein